MDAGRTALVTGASGFAGSRTARLLVARGFGVRAQVREGSDMSRLSGLDVTRVNADLTDPAGLKRLRDAMDGVGLVVHTAAYVDLGSVDTKRMFNVNVEGTRALLDAAEAAGVKQFVHCSTVRTLGDTQGRPVSGDHVRSDPGFASCYDRTKSLAETLVLSRNRPGFSTYAVLPPGIFGAGDPHFGRALDAYLDGRLPVWPAQDRPLGMVHVDDLAALFLLVAERGTPGTRYIASAGEVTMGEIFALLGEMTGRRKPFEIPEWLVRGLAGAMDVLGRITGRNMPLNRERVVFLYDSVVRTDPDRTFSELGWAPRPPLEILSDIAGAARSREHRR